MFGHPSHFLNGPKICQELWRAHYYFTRWFVDHFHWSSVHTSQQFYCQEYILWSYITWSPGGVSYQVSNITWLSHDPGHTSSSGYSPSNWPSGGSNYYFSISLSFIIISTVRVAALHLPNVSTELCCLDNLSEYVHTNSFPLLPHLMWADHVILIIVIIQLMIFRSLDSCQGNNRHFKVPFLASNHSNNLRLSWDQIVSVYNDIEWCSQYV